MTLPDSVIEYLQDLKECQRSQKTYKGYYHTLNRCLTILEKGGFTTDPKMIGRDGIGYLMESFNDLAVSTRHWYMGILGQWLKWHGNTVLEDMRIMWPQDFRINADWLTPEQATCLMRNAITPRERMCIALELYMGLRRVEILRLRIQDIDIKHSKMEVRGKGSNGGKWRTVYMPDDVAESIKTWLPIRQELIDKALAMCPTSQVPDNLLIWAHFRQIGIYAEHGTGYDKAIIKPVKQRSNIDFSNHTLRRTFGRSCWLAGVKIETISNILGHEDVRTTIKYLGIQMDDQKTAMEEVKKWRQEIEQKV